MVRRGKQGTVSPEQPCCPARARTRSLDSRRHGERWCGCLIRLRCLLRLRDARRDFLACPALLAGARNGVARSPTATARPARGHCGGCAYDACGRISCSRDVARAPGDRADAASVVARLSLWLSYCFFRAELASASLFRGSCSGPGCRACVFLFARSLFSSHNPAIGRQ